MESRRDCRGDGRHFGNWPQPCRLWAGRGVAEHISWWRQGAEGTAHRQLTANYPIDEDRLTNQSVAITLRRLLTSLGITRPVKDVSAEASSSRSESSGTVPDTVVQREMTPGGPFASTSKSPTSRPVNCTQLTWSSPAMLFLAVGYYCRPEKGTSLISAPNNAAKFVML